MYMKRCKIKLSAIVILSFLFYYPLFGSIVKMEEIKHFEKEVGDLDNHSLVLFDVDETLIVPKDAILSPRGRHLSRKLMVEILGNPAIVPPGKYPEGFLLGRVLTTAQFAIVEPQCLTVIQELQNRGIPVIALTAAEAAQMGEIEDFADFRVNQLREFGFDFRGTFPKTDSLKLAKSSEKKFHPLFKSGVLFSSDHPKGEVLKQFLSELQLFPKKVVFVDDRLDFLQSVEGAMNELGIEFIGFHYTAAEKLSPALDENLAEFQARYLAQHGRWLSDDEARKSLSEQRIE
jgi:hypothetical protein